MKFRIHEWLDTKALKTHFGIQAWDTLRKKWCHCYEGTAPLIYATKREALTKLDLISDPQETK